MKSKLFLILFILIAIAALTAAIYMFQQEYRIYAWDWEVVFRPAGLAFAQGADPYAGQGFYNPFWVLMVITPFALAGKVGQAAFAAVNIALFALGAWKVGVKNPLLIALVTLWFGTLSNLNGNIEGLFMLGLILPPSFGLLFLALKPQVGLAVMAVLMWKAYSERGLVGLSKLCLPLLGMVCLSIALYGPWFLRAGEAVTMEWNVSLWPWSLMAGLPLLGAALMRKDVRLALMAGPFLSPYIASVAYGYVFIGALAIIEDEARKIVKDILKAGKLTR